MIENEPKIQTLAAEFRAEAIADAERLQAGVVTPEEPEARRRERATTLAAIDAEARCARPAPSTPHRLRLTKRTVDNLPVPTADEGDVVWWDVELPGFGCRLLPSGRRTYILQRRTRAGRSIRVKIARTSDLTAEQARDQARRLIAQIVTGGDPAAERRAQREAERQRRLAPTIADLAEAWRADRRPHWRQRTAAEAERQLAREILPTLGKLKLEDLKPRHVREVHTRVGATAPAMANRVVSMLRAMLGWAVRRDDWQLDHNAAAGIEMNREERRERYPQSGELERLLTVLHDRDDLPGKFYLLLLLTGARRGEVETMRWPDVDLAAGVWLKPAAATKQRKLHRLPLSPEAVSLLREVQAAEPFQPFVRLTIGSSARRGRRYLPRPR